MGSETVLTSSSRLAPTASCACSRSLESSPRHLAAACSSIATCCDLLSASASAILALRSSSIFSIPSRILRYALSAALRAFSARLVSAPSYVSYQFANKETNVGEDRKARHSSLSSLKTHSVRVPRRSHGTGCSSPLCASRLCQPWSERACSWIMPIEPCWRKPSLAVRRK